MIPTKDISSFFRQFKDYRPQVYWIFFLENFRFIMYALRMNVYSTLQVSKVSIYLIFLANVKSHFIMFSILDTYSFFLV